MKIYFVIFITLFIGSGCQSQKDLSVSTSKKLIMGTSADYPPFDFRKEGQIVGIDIDLANEIAVRLGYQVEIRDMDFSSLVPSLQSGQIDFVMAGMTSTDERKKIVNFTKPYYFNHFSLIAKKETTYSKESDLKDKKLGAQLGSTMEEMGKYKAKTVSNLKLVSLTNNPILIEELKAGRIDLVLMETAQAKAFVQAHTELRLIDVSGWTQEDGQNSFGYSIAFPKFSKNKGLSHPCLKAGDSSTVREGNHLCRFAHLPLKGEDCANPLFTHSPFEEFETALNLIKQEGKLNKIILKWLGEKNV